MQQAADADETKRRKARELRYRKPIVKNLNIDRIREELYDIMSACEDVRYYFDEDEETLINALDGDEDEAFEFKMMFADLCAECERMQEDLGEEYVFEYFDLFFVAIGAGDSEGGLLGFDSYEQDYFGLQCTDGFALQESTKKLKRLTKDQLIDAAHTCFQIYHSYMGLRHRYDCLKAAMDIIRDENTGYLQMVKKIDEMYEKADKESFGFRYQFTKEVQELDRILECMPQEAWIQ
ncbi:MAG: hypothetical protein K2N87_18425 [Eubacterium sp.]|nr:hypothetical protein [Eubacterium sp.]